MSEARQQLELPVSLPEVRSDPLADIMLDFLIDHDNEEPYLDFKYTLSVSKEYPFPEVAKDLLAFSNYGGGFILLGFQDRDKLKEDYRKETRKFIPVGLPDDFRLDQADLQVKFNSFCFTPVTIHLREFKRAFASSELRFATIYIPPSTELMKARKSGQYPGIDGKSHTPFTVGAILFRRGTQSVPASHAEIEFIQKRVLDTQYTLSVLSGMPDRIGETITSNLFKVVQLPSKLYSGEPLITKGWTPPAFQNAPLAVYAHWNGRRLTFDDLTSAASPLSQRIVTGTVQEHQMAEWLADEDKRNAVVSLLNKEISFHARDVGLSRVPSDERFYFPCTGESRSENWKPRFRASSSRIVAKRMTLPKLGQRYVHFAVSLFFTTIDRDLFLHLVPTYVLSRDGANADIGDKEGAAITSLLHNKYNDAYLSSVLFWIQILSRGNDVVKLANGRVVISASSVSAQLNVGILADRPVAEPTPQFLGSEKV